MTARYFHLRSDGKTITEIDERQYRDIINRQMNSDSNAWQICRVTDNGDIYLRQGIRSMWTTSKQLEKVLKETAKC